MKTETINTWTQCSVSWECKQLRIVLLSPFEASQRDNGNCQETSCTTVSEASILSPIWTPSLGFLSVRTCELQSWVKVKVTLRPMVSRPVILGVKPHLGTKTIFMLLSIWGALSDERAGLSFVAVLVSSTCRYSTGSIVKNLFYFLGAYYLLQRT
jgi:hypothetical protein